MTKILYVILLFSSIIVLGISALFLVMDIKAYILWPSGNPLGNDFVVAIVFVVIALGSIIVILKRLFSKF